jgi:uncharacterized membrane protein YedE/YeeE
VSATLLAFLSGRVAGVSGIAWGAVSSAPGDRRWRLAFLAGLIIGAAVWFQGFPGPVAPPRSGFPLPLLLAGALLVGFGTRLGSGCTSGHGICGMARGAPRSIIAVLVFMGVAMLTTTVVRHGLA